MAGEWRCTQILCRFVDIGRDVRLSSNVVDSASGIFLYFFEIILPLEILVG